MRDLIATTLSPFALRCLAAVMLAVAGAAAARGAEPGERRPSPGLRPRSTLRGTYRLDMTPAAAPDFRPQAFRSPAATSLPVEPILGRGAPSDKREAALKLTRRLRAIEHQVRCLLEKHRHDDLPDALLAELLEESEASGKGLVIAAPFTSAPIRGFPSAGESHAVRVWSYASQSVRTRAGEENVLLCGPTIELRPGTFAGIVLVNLLPRGLDPRYAGIEQPYQDPLRFDPPVIDTQGALVTTPPNPPVGYSVTNLHTHGLHVSPDWPADDIFKEIPPGEFRTFIYEIPANQPPGTYFFHSHKHGATASQIAGGMVGPLLVRDESKGLDRLAREQGWHEQIVLVQQLTLMPDDGRGDPQGRPVYRMRPDLFYLKDVLGDISAQSSAQPGEAVITLPQYAPCQGAIRIPWDANADPKASLSSYVFVNGQFQPDMLFPANAATRLRVIHGGVEQVLGLQVRFTGAAGAAGSEETMPRVQRIAWDGIALPAVNLGRLEPEPIVISGATAASLADLAPGNRCDLLLLPPTRPLPPSAGVYELVSVADTPDPVVLCRFSFDGGPHRPEVPRPVTAADAVRARFAACQPTPPGPPTETTPLPFQMQDPQADANTVAAGGFVIGRNVFDKNSVMPMDRFTLGDTRQWLLSSTTWPRSAKDPQNHPFHIHVNSFAVDALPDWQPPANDAARFNFPTAPFWADTFFIDGRSAGTPWPIRSRFEDWTGNSVYHCHILDHEDEGMMHRIMLAPRAGGGPASSLDYGDLVDLGRRAPGGRDLDRARVIVPGGPRCLWTPGHRTLVLVMRGPECPACAAQLAAVLRERATGVLAARPFRLVVVSATAAPADAIRGLAGWRHDDMFVHDPRRHLFQQLYCIDGVPENDFTSAERRFCDTSDGRLLHGAFVVGPDGCLLHGHRGVHPFDDFVRLAAELAPRAR